MERLDQVEAKIGEITQSKIIVMGVEYDLREWLTLTNYCKKYGVKPTRLQNWIARGIVPPEAVIVVPELNLMRLIRDGKYSARKYSVPESLT